jgi:hypothetical protein
MASGFRGESLRKLLVEIRNIDNSPAYRPNKGEKGTPPSGGAGIKRSPVNKR